MKVAVISNLETQQGKSSLMYLLSSVFSRSHHKRVALFSTGDMKDMLKAVDIKEVATPAKSVSVFKAMLETELVTTDEIYDYGFRIGEEEVFAFNIFSSSLDSDELESLFMTTMGKVTADLTLVEVCGDLNSSINTKVLNAVDAVINVFNHNTRSIEAVKDYVENFDKSVVRRTGYVCQKYDANVISEKKLGSLIKMNSRNFMTIPYNTVIEKESLDGTLNTLARYIIKGNFEVVNVRSKLLEILQFLFDSPTHKYIKGVNEWHR